MDVRTVTGLMKATRTLRALELRGLARVRRKVKLWRAVLSHDGRYYLEQGRYPPPPPVPEPGFSRRLATSGRAQAEAALVTARQAIRQAPAHQERRALTAAREPRLEANGSPSLLKDIPMRYNIVVSRVQTAERRVRAVSEEDGSRKVQDELERPYGFLGGWTTIRTDIDIVTVESALGDGVPAQINQDGKLPAIGQGGVEASRPVHRGAVRVDQPRGDHSRHNRLPPVYQPRPDKC